MNNRASNATDPSPAAKLATRGPVTTHVLDIQRGAPAAGIDVQLEFHEAAAGAPAGTWRVLATATTDADGRIERLLTPGTQVSVGVYRLVFSTADYFRKLSVKTFYPSVSITFEITDARAHHHVPLLLSAFGYSTYKGT